MRDANRDVYSERGGLVTPLTQLVNPKSCDEIVKMALRWILYGMYIVL